MFPWIHQIHGLLAVTRFHDNHTINFSVRHRVDFPARRCEFFYSGIADFPLAHAPTEPFAPVTLALEVLVQVPFYFEGLATNGAVVFFGGAEAVEKNVVPAEGPLVAEGLAAEGAEELLHPGAVEIIFVMIFLGILAECQFLAQKWQIFLPRQCHCQIEFLNWQILCQFLAQKCQF